MPYRKLSKIERLKREADNLWKEVLMKRYNGKCFACGKKAIEVHHFVPKQQSVALRYDLKNGIPLCRSCHFQIHLKSDPMFVMIIAFKKGKKWVEYLQRKKKEHITVNSQWIEEQLYKLKKVGKII